MFRATASINLCVGLLLVAVTLCSCSPRSEVSKSRIDCDSNLLFKLGASQLPGNIPVANGLDFRTGAMRIPGFDGCGKHRRFK